MAALVLSSEEDVSTVQMVVITGAISGRGACPDSWGNFDDRDNLYLEYCVCSNINMYWWYC